MSRCSGSKSEVETNEWCNSPNNSIESRLSGHRHPDNKMFRWTEKQKFDLEAEAWNEWTIAGVVPLI